MEHQSNLWQHLSIGVGQREHPSVSTSVEHWHEIRTSERLEWRESVNECIAPPSDPPMYLNVLVGSPTYVSLLSVGLAVGRPVGPCIRISTVGVGTSVSVRDK